MKKIKYYSYVFLLTSIMGWFVELLYSPIFRNKIVLPGVIPPFCPIYGVGFVTIMIITNNKTNKIYSYLKIFLATTLIEYIAAYISEIYFNHIIWNYHNYLFNIDGRVCLLYSLIWGTFGYIFIYFVEPHIKNIYDKYNSKKTDLFILILLVLFIFDIIIRILV
ncbi:MAG: putative ABC transporter permease [Bacilli bacterium]|nr:putative ABC transporter permease [Bacilli bacterium]